MQALTGEQSELAALPIERRIFLEGPAGSGKTTAGVTRLGHLVRQGAPGHQILILVPQLTLGGPFQATIRGSELPPGGQPVLLTFGGLARRTVDLFWPVLAAGTGFAEPNRPPIFLTLELAQYFMSKIVDPYLEKGYFENVVLERNRLYSQILDNLNKAAIVGFSHSEIAERLKDAWVGDPSRLRNFDHVQQCAEEFRELCLKQNLLDYSLQVELFRLSAWTTPMCREYLTQSYRHLIVDNLEEDTPASHDTLLDWLPSLDSALLIMDQDGGYRRFLGADPQGVYALREACDQQLVFESSLVTTPALWAIGQSITQRDTEALDREALAFESKRFYPEMLDWVAATASDLITQRGAAPNEIVVLSPYLSDSTRFALRERLEGLDVPSYSLRPSRALREEPATKTLLTLASLVHPEWGFPPSKEQIRQALLASISRMDLVRARLITEMRYRETLMAFEGLHPEAQERITFTLGRSYERLRKYLELASQKEQTLDVFLGALFGELLSQPGYGFHNDFEAGAITANLIDSVRRFRLAVGDELSSGEIDVDAEYVALVKDGLIAAQYLRTWESQPEDAILMAPAYTFLLSNRPVDYQIWVNVGSSGWSERPYQPLTHPFVLNRHWPKGKRWLDRDELRIKRQTLNVLTQGLIRRCRRKIFLGLSELNEYGTEERGPLLDALQRTVLLAQ